MAESCPARLELLGRELRLLGHGHDAVYRSLLGDTMYCSRLQLVLESTQLPPLQPTATETVNDTSPS